MIVAISITVIMGLIAWSWCDDMKKADEYFTEVKRK